MQSGEAERLDDDRILVRERVGHVVESGEQGKRPSLPVDEGCTTDMADDQHAMARKGTILAHIVNLPSINCSIFQCLFSTPELFDRMRSMAVIFSSRVRNRAFMGVSGKQKAYHRATRKVIAPVRSMKILHGAMDELLWRMAKASYVKLRDEQTTQRRSQAVVWAQMGHKGLTHQTRHDLRSSVHEEPEGYAPCCLGVGVKHGSRDLLNGRALSAELSS